jgi:hypothetical protein
MPGPAAGTHGSYAKLTICIDTYVCSLL